MRKFYFANAGYNLRCHKRNTLRILINLIVIAVLLVAWLSMRAAIVNANEKYTKGYRSASTFTVYTEQGEDESELLSEMDAWDELSEPIRYAVMDLDKVLQSDTYVRTSNRFMTMVC